MPEFHTKKITLPSGKTVELFYLAAQGSEQAAEAAPADDPKARLRQIEICPECDSDRVHPVDWHEVDEHHWRLDVRCPDCRWMGSDVFAQDEVERYDDLLNAGTDALIEELERITRENMADHLERFLRALEDDGIMPIDF
ncbi:MAG TPA: hypothetical protein VFI18_07510 [Gaiellales bacterium]|nr:hypothetical protein [Gaiellales bacterium]